MSTEIVDVKAKIAAHQAKPIALTRKQKEAARDELKKLTEQHAPKVIETLASFVKDRKIPASSRVAAGNLILERYAGKSAKPNEEDRPEDSYSRMSEAQLLSTLCETIAGLSQESQSFIAEAILANQRGISTDFTRMVPHDFSEAEALRKERGEPPPKPRKEPRR